MLQRWLRVQQIMERDVDVARIICILASVIAGASALWFGIIRPFLRRRGGGDGGGGGGVDGTTAPADFREQPSQHGNSVNMDFLNHSGKGGAT